MFGYPGGGAKSFFLVGANALLAAYWAMAIPSVFQGRVYSGEALALSPPLRDGTYRIRSGGANFVVNQHAVDPAVEYALDIIKINALGFSAAGFFP